MIFVFILKLVYCVYSLESPQWVDSNENTQNTFMLKKIEKISLLHPLTWRYDLHPLAQTIPVSKIFSWSQRCSSHWSSTVYDFFSYYLKNYHEDPPLCTALKLWNCVLARTEKTLLACNNTIWAMSHKIELSVSANRKDRPLWIHIISARAYILCL